MAKNTKLYDAAFLTGCDKKTEWMLPWFIENYKKHNKAPIILANFGLSDEAESFARNEFHAIINLSNEKEKGWFKKPKAMLTCPSKKTIWIDTDCEVKEDISTMFSMLEPNKLAMVQDHPWTQRRGELWHNSGVVGFIDKPNILKQWAKQVSENKGLVGDQEVLHAMLNPITKISYIKDLPHKYNVLRIDFLDGNYPKNPKIIHWTGHKGKNHIRSLIHDA